MKIPITVEDSEDNSHNMFVTNESLYESLAHLLGLRESPYFPNHWVKLEDGGVYMLTKFGFVKRELPYIKPKLSQIKLC